MKMIIWALITILSFSTFAFEEQDKLPEKIKFTENVIKNEFENLKKTTQLPSAGTYYCRAKCNYYVKVNENVINEKSLDIGQQVSVDIETFADHKLEGISQIRNLCEKGILKVYNQQKKDFTRMSKIYNPNHILNLRYNYGYILPAQRTVKIPMNSFDELFPISTISVVGGPAEVAATIENSCETVEKELKTISSAPELKKNKAVLDNARGFKPKDSNVEDRSIHSIINK